VKFTELNAACTNSLRGLKSIIVNLKIGDIVYTEPAAINTMFLGGFQVYYILAAMEGRYRCLLISKLIGRYEISMEKVFTCEISPGEFTRENPHWIQTIYEC
jgi:hypothetical protein